MTQDKTTIVKPDTDIMEKLSGASFQIEMFFKGKEYTFTRNQLPITIGRDEDKCDLVSEATTASRTHCIISISDTQIGLTDQSTNGTYIKIGRGEEILIKNSFYPLVGQGTFSLGEPIDYDSDETIHFRISSNPSISS